MKPFHIHSSLRRGTTSVLAAGMMILCSVSGIISAHADLQIIPSPTVSGKLFLISSESAIAWEGLSDQETAEITKWLSLSETEQTEIRTQVVEFWSSYQALPMPVFDPEVVRGMLAYYENVNLRKYRDEASEKGIIDTDWNLFIANVLRAWYKSESPGSWIGNPDKFQNYVDYDEIIRLGLEQDTTGMLLDSNGNPGVLLFNCEGETERINDGIIEAIVFYKENSFEDIVDVLKFNKVCLFCPINTGKNTLLGTFNEFGCIYMTYTKEAINRTPDRAMFARMASLFYVESRGICYERLCNNLGIDVNLFLADSMKSCQAGVKFLNLYEKTKVEDYKILGNNYLADAENSAEDHFTTLDDPKLVVSLEFMDYYGIAR